MGFFFIIIILLYFFFFFNWLIASRIRSRYLNCHLGTGRLLLCSQVQHRPFREDEAAYALKSRDFFVARLTSREKRTSRQNQRTEMDKVRRCVEKLQFKEEILPVALLFPRMVSFWRLKCQILLDVENITETNVHIGVSQLAG